MSLIVIDRHSNGNHRLFGNHVHLSKDTFRVILVPKCSLLIHYLRIPQYPPQSAAGEFLAETGWGFSPVPQSALLRPIVPWEAGIKIRPLGRRNLWLDLASLDNLFPVCKVYLPSILLFTILLGGPQGGGIHHVKLNMVAVQLEISPHQMGHFGDTLSCMGGC